MTQTELITEIIATAEKIRQDYPYLPEWEVMMIAVLLQRNRILTEQQPGCENKEPKYQNPGTFFFEK